jgi:hypothetical protein
MIQIDFPCLGMILQEYQQLGIFIFQSLFFSIFRDTLAT